MTTLADAIKTALEDNWSGAGGTAPKMYNSEDHQQEPLIDDDWIMILQETYDESMPKRHNDVYVSRLYEIKFRVSTKGDADLEERLDTIVTECYRIITPSAVTGYNWVDIVRQLRDRNRAIKRYYATLTVRCTIRATSSTATAGSITTSEWEVDELTVNTWVKTPTIKDDAGTTRLNLADMTFYTPVGDVMEFQERAGGSGTALKVYFEQGAGCDEIGLVSKIGPLALRTTDGGDPPELLLEDDGMTILGTTKVAAIVDQDDMADDSATKLCTQQSIKAYVDAVLTSANAAWYPCAYIAVNEIGKHVLAAHYLGNVDATDIVVGYMLPLPTVKGSRKLHVTGLRTIVNTADATDYVNTIKMFGVTEVTGTLIVEDLTNRTAQGDYTTALADTDVSGYDYVIVYIYLACATAEEVKIGLPLIECFYDT